MNNFKYLLLVFIFFSSILAEEKQIINLSIYTLHHQDEGAKESSTSTTKSELEKKEKTRIEPTQANPFKFGMGFFGYSVALNNNFANKFGRNGWNGYLEFAGLIYRHYEIGVRLGMDLLAFSDLWSGKTGVTLNTSIMPYLRYYFLEIPEIRPYLLGGIGYSSSSVLGIDAQVGNQTINLGVYSGSFVGTRIGGGIRLVRYLDFSVLYYYAGRITGVLDQTQQLINKDLKKSYHLHLLELQFAFVFGGNLHHNR